MRFTFFSIILLALTGGCSKSPAPVAPPSASADATPARTIVQIQPLTAVATDLPTHIAAGGAGLFFVQETEEGHDRVFHIDDLNVAEETKLTGDAVAAAMGLKDVNGNFQGLAVAGDAVYFYFVGSAQRSYVSCVARWTPPSGKIQILADNAQLASLLDPGATLSICRGEMTQANGIVWLWLHSIDGSYFLQIDTTTSQAKPAVTRPFQKLVADYMPPDFTHDNYGVGAGSNGSILILDSWLGALWRIRPDGIVKQLHLLIGLPKEMSSPITDDQNRIVIFATGNDLIPPRLDTQSPEPMDYTEFPAFLLFTDEKITSYPKSMLRTQTPYDLDHLKFKNLCPLPDGTEWIAYDPTAGELFHISVTHP